MTKRNQLTPLPFKGLRLAVPQRIVYKIALMEFDCVRGQRPE